MKNKVLVIGLGDIGMLYDYKLSGDFILSHCKAFSAHKDFNLCGAVDPDKKKHNLFKQTFNKPVYLSVSEALTLIKPNIVVIATPSGSHLKVINEVLDNTKPDLILCEKPLDYDLNDAENIINRCNADKVPIFVNYIRKSHEGSNIIKNMIDNDKICPPFKVNVWYSKGLLNNGSHFLNLLEFWFGNIKSILYAKIGSSWDGFDYDVDFIVKFNECIVNFQVSPEKSQSYNSMELFSKNGRLFYENGGEKISWQTLQKDNENSYYMNDNKEYLPSSMDKYQLDVTNELSNFLNKRPYKLCSGEEALVTIKNIYKILKEAKL